MSATQDPSPVDAFVETLKREGRAYAVGSFGSGKSALLRTVASVVPHAVIVSPPVGDGDATEAALIDVAEQLHEGAIEEVVRDPSRPTAEKVEAVVAACARRDDLVLLLDDPFAWAFDERDRSPDLLFRLRDGILDSPNAVGIAGRALSASLSHEPILLEVEAAVPSRWLNLDWGELGDYAATAASAAPQRLLPLHAFAFRVLCQAVSFETRDAWPTREVLRRLYRHMRETAPELAQTWSTLTTIRRSEDEQVVRHIANSFAHHNAVELCFRRLSEPGEVRLPAAFRVVGAIEDGRVTAPLHDRLADAWGERTSLVASYERFHHAARGTRGVAEEIKAPLLVEQWHSLGRWLSQRGEFAGAAAVFWRAVTQDQGDAYAHHYLAFNLDVEGRDAPTVQEHYGRALDLDPTVVWWHSRFIRFLITRERMDDAREAWDRALLRLPVDEAASDDQLFVDLHAEVARQLIDAVELDFAEEVLAGVPEEAFVHGSRFGDLRDELLRVEAAVNGNPLLPVTADEQDGERPSLVPEYREGWGPLEAWWLATIDDVREDGQVVLTAEEHAPGAAPRLMTAAATTHDLRADGVSPSALQPGRLLEFGFYGDDQTLILEHPTRRRLTWAARTPFPDPMRYVRRSSD
jgi:tetratricopeptide (TPR) repeat protein